MKPPFKTQALLSPVSVLHNAVKNFLAAIYFNKTSLERALVLSCLFSIGLTFFRVIYTKQWYFVWLGWNLFLAIVPYLITRTLIRQPRWIQSNGRFVLSFAVWLLFLPNSFYIITDLFHLQLREGVPYWFDLALIFSFAWNGILLGAASIRQMEKMLSVKWTTIREWQFVYPLMLLNALGIYIGP
jgi:uncharacterized membrane protein